MVFILGGGGGGGVLCGSIDGYVFTTVHHRSTSIATDLEKLQCIVVIIAYSLTIHSILHGYIHFNQCQSLTIFYIT